MKQLTFDIEFPKFCNYVLGKWFVDNTKKKTLIGTFIEVNGDTEVTEEFEVLEVRGGAFETYKCYIAYFNRTLRPYEKRRIGLKAHWKKLNEEGKEE